MLHRIAARDNQRTQNKIEALTAIKRSETQVQEFLKETPSPLPPCRDVVSFR
jgi:hypothetical protein